MSVPLHVVFFNRAFFPEESATSQLLTELAEGLVQDHACCVSVVAGFPQGAYPPTWTSPPGRGLLLKETFHGISVWRARGTRLSKRFLWGRIANYLSYFASACLARCVLGRAHVVIALTDPPIVGLAALWTVRRFRCPFALSFRDIFPEVARLERHPHPVIEWMLEGVNRFLLRRADRIVALGEDMKRRLVQEKGVLPERVVVIRDWADTALIQPAPKRNPFSIQHGLADRFVVMHSGNLGLSQNLEMVLETTARLRDLTELVAVFMGDGVKRDWLETESRRRGLGHVRFLPRQPKENLSEAFAAADCFLITLRPGLSGYITPSKLYGILAAGRPYVASVDPDSDVARITEQYHCGLLARPDDPDDLAQKIRLLYSDRELARRMGGLARGASALYDRRRGVQAYAALCTELAGKRVG